MILTERRELIKSILLEKKHITVAEMAKYFQTSTETIRRDFEALEKEGFLIKSYGGATLIMRKSVSFSQKMKSGIMTDIKKKMAVSVAKLIKPHDCIFLDHSTTVYELCDEIAHLPLTVMTNSLVVINRFSGCDNIQMTIPGGNFSSTHQAFFGLEAVGYLQRHCVDKAFLSCNTLDIARGLNDSEEMVADMRKNIVENSGFTCLLADNTKFNKTAFIRTCDFSGIDCIATDQEPDHAWKRFAEEAHIKWLISDKE
ncbi:MAG: DeoR/GlpR family DNA-binding transcription regulator [Hungatella sp.]